MKLAISINLLVSPMMYATAYAHDHQQVDATGKVWAFASSGIHVFSPDGQRETLHRQQDEVCQATPTSDDPGVVTTDCRYVEGVDDGERYVWVSNSRLANDRPDSHRYYMDAYDRTTAQLVASIPTCSIVRKVQYASHRREIWNNCWINSGMEIPSEGQIDVFSTSAFGVDHDMVVLGDIAHEHGNVFIDEALPLMAFGFSTSGGTLFEIEPNTKQVVMEHEIPGSKAGGEFAFSKVNKHLFIRNYNDCSCGVDKDTGVACDLSRAEGYKGLKNVTVTTGPNASLEPQLGFSGKFCRGSKADTNGVWEYEPSSRQFLRKHVVPNANGAKPFTTPAGDFILLAAGDGSNTVSVLKPGATGEPSKFVGTIQLSFGNADGKHDASDIDFVQDTHKGELYAIFSSNLHNHVMVAELHDFYSATAENTVAVDNAVDILLHEGDKPSARWDPRGINVRRIRAIPESNFVWVDAPETDQVFVIEMDFNDISKTRVAHVIDGLDAKDIVYVAPSTETAAQQSALRASASGASQQSALRAPASGASNSLSIAAILLSIAAIVAVGYLAFKGKMRPAQVRNESPKKKEMDPENSIASLPSIR